MTSWAERDQPLSESQLTLDTDWRAAATAAQLEALPEGSAVVSCPARNGAGGLGRHLREIIEAFERRGTDAMPISKDAAPGPAAASSRALNAAFAPLARVSPAWRMWRASVVFDLEARHRLPGRAEHLIAFNGTALAQMRAARRARYGSLALVSANSHFRRVVRRHEQAHEQYPVEPQWVTRLLRRNLEEYARADRIHVASRYIWESFVDEGHDESELSFFPLTPDPRFVPADTPPTTSTFDVVYVGSLTVHKGLPLLLDAFSRLPHPDLRLVLVGGWTTREMRRHVEAACARDPRIAVGPGDPLPHLRDARLCAHPAYEDGFGYAPAEALAAGVPVLVSEDTGMKELVEHGRNGLVLPTGDVEALAAAIDAAYRREILDV